MDFSTNFNCEDKWVLLSSSEDSLLSFKTISFDRLDEEEKNSSDESAILETNDEEIIEAAQILCRMKNNEIMNANILLNIKNDSLVHERGFYDRN